MGELAKSIDLETFLRTEMIELDGKPVCIWVVFWYELLDSGIIYMKLMEREWRKVILANFRHVRFEIIIKNPSRCILLDAQVKNSERMPWEFQFKPSAYSNLT